MSCQTHWYIENQIIYSQFWGAVTVDDMRAALKQSYEMVMKSDQALVHSITDVSAVTTPLSARDLTKIVSSVKTTPRTGWIITVGEKDMMMKFISNVARQIFKLHQRTFDTLEDALKFLWEVDGAIDWSKADESVFKQEITHNE